MTRSRISLDLGGRFFFRGERAVVFLREDPAKPLEDGSRFHELTEFCSLFGGKLFAHNSQASALVFGEVDATLAGDGLQDVFEDEHLFRLVFQRLLLALIDRAGNHGNEES